jgi:thymidylate synthase
VQYAVLIYMLAQVNDMVPGELVHVISDAHIYDRHIPMVQEILKNPQHKAPKVIIDPNVTNFYDFTVDSFQLVDYEYEQFNQKIPVAI